MKNKFLTITAVFILFFSIFLLLLIGKMLLPKKEMTFDQTNKTFVVEGDVKIKKAISAAGWQKMEPSTILEKGDIVETAEGSTVDIIIGKNTDKAVKMEEKSYVEFQGINPTYLNFSRGKILAAIKKLEPKSSFVVKTPTSICGVRGTGWSEKASENETRICVFESEVFMREVDANGKPKIKKHTAREGSAITLLKNKPISKAQKIEENDLQDWGYWSKNIAFLRERKILISDFNKRENLNNLSGPFGSWNIFYSDTNQYCKDEFTGLEKIGDEGYGLKLTYDVDSPFSAYNGFFTNLMGIDISDYKYLVFFIKGDKNAGFTNKLNVELKNKFQTGKMTIEGITDEWKKMVLPLGRFAGISDFKSMKEFVIVFSDINVTKKEGIIYIDDIYFADTDSPS